MASIFDLHTHSTASDGTLPPSDVVAQADADGVRVLALTDHDSTAGITEARTAAERFGTVLVPGVELSVTWKNKLLHIVGLGIDVDDPTLAQGLTHLHAIRETRAEEMGRKLARVGIDHAYEGAQRLAGDGRITRTHFARFLVQEGRAKNFRDAFKRLLARGRPGYVPTTWASLDDAVEWIRIAGGAPVLAHPMRYRLTHAWMQRVLGAFKEAGGTGIEVACARNTRADMVTTVEYAVRFGLLGSVGSDYHGPETPCRQIGDLASLPPHVTPVWQSWDIVIPEK